jgi:hypothetical protein
MIKSRLNFYLLFIICTFSFNANALDSKYKPTIKNFIDLVKSSNHAAIADRITYPLNREYPIPSIKNKQQMLKRFDEVFDESLLKSIINSDIEKDWDDVGWRGIMLSSGGLWLDYDGKLIAVNYQSDAEKNIKTKLINEQKNALYPSLKSYVAPVLEWETSKFRIRIDDLGHQKYRYAAWPLGKSTSDKPDLVLLNGKVTFEGSGGNHFYAFSKGKYQYQCDVNVIGESSMPPGSLSVYKENKLIYNDEVVKVLEN